MEKKEMKMALRVKFCYICINLFCWTRDDDSPVDAVGS